MIVIYYLATSGYKKGFDRFQKSVKHFFPQEAKKVIVISDGLQEWDGVEQDGVQYKVHHIHHYPWPIITLFKMKYILDYWEEGEYAYYFNANFTCTGNQNRLDLTKLNSDLLSGARFHETNKCSKAYVDNPSWIASGGFFGGPSNLVKEMCAWVCDAINSDLSQNIIPKWHDQGYLTKWCYDNQDKINVKPFVGNLFQIFYIYKPRKG